MWGKGQGVEYFRGEVLDDACVGEKGDGVCEVVGGARVEEEAGVGEVHELRGECPRCGVFGCDVGGDVGEEVEQEGGAFEGVPGRLGDGREEVEEGLWGGGGEEGVRGGDGCLLEEEVEHELVGHAGAARVYGVARIGGEREGHELRGEREGDLVVGRGGYFDFDLRFVLRDQSVS